MLLNHIRLLGKNIAHLIKYFYDFVCIYCICIYLEFILVKCRGLNTYFIYVCIYIYIYLFIYIYLYIYIFGMVLGLLDQRIVVFCIFVSFGHVPLQKFEVNCVEELKAILNLYL